MDSLMVKYLSIPNQEKVVVDILNVNYEQVVFRRVFGFVEVYNFFYNYLVLIIGYKLPITYLMLVLVCLPNFSLHLGSWA